MTQTLVERFRTAEKARDAFERARAAMNAARPDPVHATRAERALYDERYQADNEAERAYRIAALELFTSGGITEAADTIESLTQRVDALETALEPLANLDDVNMHDPLSKWLTISQIKDAAEVIKCRH